MKGYYNIKGDNIILERENKEDIVLSITESIEIFATVADIQKNAF